MTEREVRVFRSLEELSREAAARFVELARQGEARGGIFSAALSGGSTPRRLYELISAPAFSRKISWERVHLFQVDERCVALEQPESNYRMIRETLLSRVPVPPLNFHRMLAESPDREAACRHYARELARVLRPEGKGWPRLDLIFLGMGTEGHTASLFPGSPVLDEQLLWVRPVWVAKLASHRLTLTLPVLNAAAHVNFLVSGAEKAETLHEVLEGDRQVELLPAQRVRPARGQVSWYVDEAAAKRLSRVTGSAP